MSAIPLLHSKLVTKVVRDLMQLGCDKVNRGRVRCAQALAVVVIFGLELPSSMSILVVQQVRRWRWNIQ